MAVIKAIIHTALGLKWRTFLKATGKIHIFLFDEMFSIAIQLVLYKIPTKKTLREFKHLFHFPIMLEDVVDFNNGFIFDILFV